MTAFTTLTLNSKVYAPSGYLNGISTWTERSSEYSNGYSLLTNKVWQAMNNGTMGAYHSQSKITLPVVAVDGDSDNFQVGMLRSNSWVDIHAMVGNLTSAAERLDLYERVKAFVATDAFKNSIVNNEPVLGA